MPINNKKELVTQPVSEETETSIAESSEAETPKTETPVKEAAHTHIDFASLNPNDPKAVEAIDLSGITCEACLHAYEEHFGEAAGEGSGDLLAGVEFKPTNFVNNLPYMGTGMIGIFIVIALIMGVTTFLNKAFSGKKDGEQ